MATARLKALWSVWTIAATATDNATVSIAPPQHHIGRQRLTIEQAIYVLK